MKATTLLLALAAPLVAACSSPDATAVTKVEGPVFGDQGTTFRPVSAVIERRCGTLDCHGSVVRPLLIYGQYGLRLAGGGPIDAGDYPGGLTQTTVAELTSNYQSMCGLEPELTNLVVEKKDQPESLTLVRKPRLLEKHKGGLVWNKGDPGDTCLVDWLTGVKDSSGNLDTSSCAAEIMHP